MAKNDLTKRIVDNSDLILGTVLGMFILAFAGFPILKETTSIENTVIK